jgi:predicted metalloprotease with PDZ domain
MPEPAATTAEVWKDLRPLLDRELSRLPDKYRVAVVLCDLEGRTRQDAAHLLGIPVGTLSGRLTTARRRLALRLTRHGVALSSTGLVAVISESTGSACIPVPLVVSTVKAVTAVAAGQAAAGIVSAKVAALMEGVVKSMLLTNLKSMTIVLLAATLFGGGGTLLTIQALGGEPKGARQVIPAQAGAAHDEQAKPDKKTKNEPDKPATKTYGFLGVILNGESDPKQALVHEVFPDSPAAKAGIQAGDVLLKVGDVQVQDPNEAVKILKASKPGDQVTLYFKRENKEMKAAITLGEWPAEGTDRPTAKEKKEAKEEKARGYLGLILRDDADNGTVVVQEIAPDSPADKAGIKPDDIVVRVDDVRAKDAGEVVKGLANLKAGDKVRLRIKRDGKGIDVTVTAAKRPADFGKM